MMAELPLQSWIIQVATRVTLAVSGHCIARLPGTGLPCFPMPPLRRLPMALLHGYTFAGQPALAPTGSGRRTV